MLVVFEKTGWEGRCEADGRKVEQLNGGEQNHAVA